MVLGTVEFHYFQYKYGSIPEVTCIVKDTILDKNFVCLIESGENPEKFNQYHQSENMYIFEGEETELDPELFGTLSYNIQDYIRDNGIIVSDIIFVKDWDLADEIQELFIF